MPAIVSSHVGCGPDLVEDGLPGWIFEAGNREALGEVIHKAIAAGSELKPMGERARQRVDRYSYDEASRVLITVLEANVPAK